MRVSLSTKKGNHLASARREKLQQERKENIICGDVFGRAVILLLLFGDAHQSRRDDNSRTGASSKKEHREAAPRR